MPLERLNAYVVLCYQTVVELVLSRKSLSNIPFLGNLDIRQKVILSHHVWDKENIQKLLLSVMHNSSICGSKCCMYVGNW